MKRILITGISGTGKSTITLELAKRGCKAVDLDSDAYSQWSATFDDDPRYGTPVEAGRDWVWREDRVRALLDVEDTNLLIVSGCAPNMREILPRFDQVILLTAPASLIAERLATRTTNDYGKRPEEITRVLELKQTVEPRLRQIADHEIDTSADLQSVLATVLRVAE
jgi:broad-specificity NMP kinase